ncbi:glycosyltransferase family 2 protein [Marinobacter halodurans]|uniref:Glycosyltransferase family 2 protein n=1 Tax=Marinobacter halodurans TaxID=2528979 RepID=A0ABY1ZH16_9GAMM|nr:glycosyltransferase family 2 protein [Marinobacter halodurans]TBW51590.1 glycosyltransferase family 2 protein [Marinobacter halodurans]
MDVDRPLVSVCIAAFNAGPYLRDAVSSVQRQRIADIEVIIVNDGSTDDTLSVARSLEESDHRIVVIDQPNRGSCVARNAAFDRARGRYICTLDADDIWAEGKLIEQLEILKENPKSVVIGGVKRFSDVDGEWVWGDETMPFPVTARRSYLKHLLSMPDVEKVLLNTLCAPTEFIKSDNWDPVFRTGHDWEVWIRLASKYSFIHVAKVYQYYRKHPVSTTKRNRVRMVGDCQLMVIERHGPNICDSRIELNQVIARCAMHFAATSLYLGCRRDALHFIWRALLAGGAPLASRQFYGLLLRSLVSLMQKRRSQQLG